MGTIYKITLKQDGRSYIGLTSRSLETRLIEHKYESKKFRKTTNYFYNAIKKYGWESFESITLIETDNIDALNAYENYYVSLFGTRDDKFGFNLKDGGGAKGRMSDRTKQLLSQLKKGKYIGEKNPMFGKTGEKSPLFGRKHTEETKRKMREARKNISDETRKKLVEANTGEKNPMYGKTPHNKGVSMSNEIKIKVSQAIKKSYADKLAAKLKTDMAGGR